jgi:hypothetical protein
MHGTKSIIRVAATVILTLVLSSQLLAAGSSSAMMSAALGGPLGDGMNDAGGAGHGRFIAAAQLHEGRLDAYRKQAHAKTLIATATATAASR